MSGDLLNAELSLEPLKASKSATSDSGFRKDELNPNSYRSPGQESAENPQAAYDYYSGMNNMKFGERRDRKG